MAKSLLERALEVKRPDKRLKDITAEEIEVSLAWLADEVSLTQIATVMGMKGPGHAVSRMAICIREAYRLGFLKIVNKR